MAEDSRTQVCKLCNTGPLEQIVYIQHILSKRHQKNLKNATPSRDVTKRTVHVTGYNPRTPVEAIAGPFWKYKIRSILYTPNFSFIEFETVELAQEVLKARIMVQGKVLKVSERRQNMWGQDRHNDNFIELNPSLEDSLSKIVRVSSLDGLVMKIVNDIELRREDNLIRENFRRGMEQFLTSDFPNAMAYVFGSSTNNIGFRGCDVDLYVDLGVNPWATGSKEEMESNAESLTRYLARSIRNSRRGINVQPIARARVPIVKFVDSVTKLQVDLSFKHGMPVFNTELIRQYTHTHHLVRPYLMIIRYWAKIQGISGGGYPSKLITNYALTMLMLFYLMIRSDPIVPSLDNLRYIARGYVPFRHSINGWDCGFLTDVSAWSGRKHNTTIFELATEFFEYYGNLNAKRWMVSPLAGCLINRMDVVQRNMASLPMCMVAYCRQDVDIKIESPLCVQDVFELNFNITKGLLPESLDNFQLKCRKAGEICRNILSGNQSLARLLEPIGEPNKHTSDKKAAQTTEKKETAVQARPGTSTSSNDIVEVITIQDEVKAECVKPNDDQTANGLDTCSPPMSPEKSVLKFLMDFTRSYNFTVTLDGNVEGGGELLSQADDISQSACSLIHFILQEVLKITTTEQLVKSTGKKRKSDGLDDEESVKRRKTTDGGSVPVPIKYRCLAHYDCLSETPLWIGRKKIAKRVPPSSHSLNPFLYEKSVTEMQIQALKEEADIIPIQSDPLKFTLGVWQDCIDPHKILITGDSKSDIRVTKAQMMPMFTYLTSVAQVLLKRVIHYLSTSSIKR